MLSEIYLVSDPHHLHFSGMGVDLPDVPCRSSKGPYTVVIVVCGVSLFLKCSHEGGGANILQYVAHSLTWIVFHMLKPDTRKLEKIV
jgi:hypothetical protein